MHNTIEPTHFIAVIAQAADHLWWMVAIPLVSIVLCWGMRKRDW